MTNLNNQLLPYQKAGVEKLIKLKVGALFMEQGTGKTITALDICRIRLEKRKINHILWLCPCSVKQGIKKEILKHANDLILKNVTLCGIETLSSSIRTNIYLQKLVIQKKVFLIVDESSLVKNYDTYRTRNIQILANKCTYKLILNGTPISKNEADLFSQFYILDWRILGYQSYWSFAASHLKYDEENPKKIIRCLNVEYLLKKIEPYSYQIKKQDCMSLPAKIYKTEYFSITDEQRKHYDDISNQLLFDLDEINSTTIYRLFTALQAIACSRRVSIYTDELCNEHIVSSAFFDDERENPRLKALTNIIKNEKTIIFCNYTDDITRICNVLNKYSANSAVRFDGTISYKERNNNISKFSTSATYLVANRNCASYSLNLQFCSKIIYYSNSWCLASRLQSEDRVHRIGQSKEVEIIDICANNTIDIRILECLHKKEDLLNIFKNNLKNAANISTLLQWLRGQVKKKRYVKIFDCSDLEEYEDAQNL